MLSFVLITLKKRFHAAPELEKNVTHVILEFARVQKGRFQTSDRHQTGAASVISIVKPKQIL